MHKTVFYQKILSHISIIPTVFSLLIVLLYILTVPIHAAESPSDPAITLFQGNTMGTTYHIKVVMQKGDDKKKLPDSSKKSLHSLIEDRLKEVNQSMSVYSKSSEISLFNNAHQGEIVKISPEFYFVMLTSQKLYKMTDGAWDGTVKPLVDLWGFGTKDQITAIPSSDNIKAILENIGFDQISIQDRTLKKQNSAITLDLGSIAKGFGVDAIGQLLKEQGYTNFLVEIGGEVVASGKKMEGIPWMVGISRPDKGGDPNDIYSSFELKDRALATSGDYRNFITIDGKTYSHIIDPVSGYPVDNGVVSTSVIAESCTFADGLATALMVMGQERGIKLVNTLEKTECLIVVRNKEGILKDYRSKKFPLP